MLEIGTRDWYMPSTCLDTRVALPPGILIISEMGTLSVYVATCDRGEQRTFILLFWSQVSYNIIHIVRYNVALFSLPKESRQSRKENVQGRAAIPNSNVSLAQNARDSGVLG